MFVGFLHEAADQAALSSSPCVAGDPFQTLVAPTSGSHLNPCITIVQVLTKGFGKMRALRYDIFLIVYQSSDSPLDIS